MRGDRIDANAIIQDALELGDQDLDVWRLEFIEPRDLYACKNGFLQPAR